MCGRVGGEGGVKSEGANWPQRTTVATKERTRRRARRTSAWPVRNSVCFHIMPASSSCRHTALSSLHASPAPATTYPRLPAAFTVWAHPAHQTAPCSARALRGPMGSTRACKQGGRVLSLSRTLGVDEVGVEVADVAQAVAAQLQAVGAVPQPIVPCAAHVTLSDHGAGSTLAAEVSNHQAGLMT